METTKHAASVLEADLPQIEMPQPAVAETNQRKHMTTCQPPRGVVTRLLPSTPTTHPIPHELAANWFKQVHDGYVSANYVHFAKYATDPVKMLHAESLELTAAAKQNVELDQSLFPRRVGVWLLGCYGEHPSNFLDVLLDSMGRWATSKVQGSKMATILRMNAAFDTDAKYMLDATRYEFCSIQPHPSSLTSGDAMILLRWNDGNSIRAAYRRLDPKDCKQPNEYIMRLVQDNVVIMSGLYNIPLPKEVMVPFPTDKHIQNEFYIQLCRTHQDFFDLLVGTPSITFSQETRDRNASRILQPTGCMVRVCNKALGSERTKDASCFHGAVVGLANKRKEIMAFLEESDNEGIRPPVSKDERELGLHLCAVQAERFCLGSLITLFGTSGITGKPIHSPGSWIWVARPAVRPIQSDLLNVFSLHPCSRMSMLPGTPELVPAFERFWKHTTLIYKMIAEGESKLSTDDQYQRSRSPSPTQVYQIALKENDIAAIRLMQLDMQSKRTTLGDAYAQLCMIPSAHVVAENIKQAMARVPNGVRASLSDMFEYNTELIRNTFDSENAKRKSADALVFLSEVALDVASYCNRSKSQRLNEPLCLSAERVRRILKACSVKGADHMNIDFGTGANPDHEDLLESIIKKSVAYENTTTEKMASVSPLMKRSFKKAFKYEDPTVSASKGKWLATVENAVAAAASVAMVASGAINTMLFLVVGTMNENEVLIKAVALDGSISGSSLDDMCRVSKPKVVILQQLAENRIRVTGTTAI